MSGCPVSRKTSHLAGTDFKRMHLTACFEKHLKAFYSMSLITTAAAMAGKKTSSAQFTTKYGRH